MLNPRRNGALAAMVVSALAVLAPSSAFASHDLSIYKAEAQVDLSADQAATSVSCRSGDHAVDGMWRIDHADQDEYVTPNDLIGGAVDVLAAYPSDDSTYSFIFEKNAIGRAQAKVWVTCLGNKTQGGSHTHKLAGGFTTHSGGAGFDTQTTEAAGTGSTTNAVVTKISTDDHAGSCPSGTYLVSPGFKVDPDATTPPDLQDDANFTTPAAGGITDPSVNMMRLFESDSSTGQDWTWQFENSALPNHYRAEIHTYWRCLKVKIPTSTTATDHHKYVFKTKTSTADPSPSSVSEARLNCGDAYKGILGGFRIASSGDKPTAKPDGTSGYYTPVVGTTAFDDVFYLGMDPRIKQRAFRFVNRGSNSNANVALSLLCLNYRTT